VAMIPAVVWAIVAQGPHTPTRIVGLFTLFYLLICQLLIVSRYVLIALAITALGPAKRFDIRGGYIGFVGAGFIIDSLFTVIFANYVMNPGGHDTFMTPIVFFAYGLAAMLIAGLVGGATGSLLRSQRH
jgi:hypothetical protein